MSECWDEYGLYNDNTPFNGEAIYKSQIYIEPQQPQNDYHYRVFFKHNNGTLSSNREYTIDAMNNYIKREVASDCSIAGYLLCSWINNEYRECRHSRGWDTTITHSLMNGQITTSKEEEKNC